MSRLLYIMILGLNFSLISNAQTTLRWTGAVNENWGNSANWSPAKVPTSADNVVFENSAINCTIDNFACVKGWLINDTYSGTIYQGKATEVCVGIDGFKMYGGTYIGGEGYTFYFSDKLIVLGGIFELTQTVIDLKNCEGYCTPSSIAIPESILKDGYFTPDGVELLVYFEDKYNREFSPDHPFNFTIYNYKRESWGKDEVPIEKIGTNLYSLSLSSVPRHKLVTDDTREAFYILEIEDNKGFKKKLRFKY